jgi:hypothetical protein
MASEKKQLILIPEQAGFRPHLSIDNQVVHMQKEIKDALQEKKHTVVVWMDMEKKDNMHGFESSSGHNLLCV